MFTQLGPGDLCDVTPLSAWPRCKHLQAYKPITRQDLHVMAQTTGTEGAVCVWWHAVQCEVCNGTGQVLKGGCTAFWGPTMREAPRNWTMLLSRREHMMSASMQKLLNAFFEWGVRCIFFRF